ncbi:MULTISPECIES: hypothetical protein [unclassified Ensifer]|uniref:hypothetical protein n=1 Tax=unclassified Ensifer TaxID=2633371 RepID=UPI0008132EF5|nr:MULTISPECIES: hypothetical protein [unclassified Ensifer]OCP19768.1 hypothetical protein BC361_30075 [Ensifer sp. LC54]OCP25961.1 hypothetical protein BC363_19575 [Ensifer sp. LC384]
MQYVVRTIEEPEGEAKFKVFGTKPNAEAYFRSQAEAARTGEIEIATLFEVDCHDVRDAVEAVKAGNKKQVALLAQRLSTDALMASCIRKAIASWHFGDLDLP